MEPELCDDESLTRAAALMASGDPAAAGVLDRLGAQFPADPRVSFLQASMLVAGGRLVEAHDAFARTLEIAPAFALARYQYGFFLLTSGEVARALEVWGPLDQLPDGHHLREALDGMRCLVRDDFAGVRRHFARAMAANAENEALNADLRLLMSRLDESITGVDGATGLADVPGEAVSEAALLLQQFGRGRLH